MATTYFVLPAEAHDALVTAAFRARGFTAAEAAAAARFCHLAAEHGIHTHNVIKALHLDDHFGSRVGGCVPAVEVERLPSKYKGVQRWNAKRSLGMSVAFAAMDQCMTMADELGIGAVTVDNAFHYLWGGGYVIDAAKRGYIAYTGCTSTLAEVVPFGGKFPTLGTNPHSWAFPTTAAVGFPICIDWATSTVAMGRVQQFAREGRQLPGGAAVDSQGHETTDPNKVAALLPFGAHKGYGLSLIDELMAAYTGGSLPVVRGKRENGPKGEKHTSCFFFQCIKAEALDCGDFALGRSQAQNVTAVLADILGHGNEKCMLPGQPEAEAAALSRKHGGLLFTAAEMDALGTIAEQANVTLQRNGLKSVEV
jgi:LDH2 family malate/lactate/ureidoglycolate dehydrogenase